MSVPDALSRGTVDSDVVLCHRPLDLADSVPSK
jgi:hypothetical protein